MIFNINFFLFTFGLSCIQCYTFVFAKHYAHVSNAEYGILAAVFPALALVAKPVSCAVTDALGIHKKFLIGSLTVFALSYGSLGFVALLKDPNSFEHDRLCWFVIAAQLLLGFVATACIYCMNDALASNYARKHNLSYSRMRFWACLGWASGALVLMAIGNVSWLPLWLPGIIILAISISADIIILLLWPYDEDFEMFHDGSTPDQRKLSIVGPNTVAYLRTQQNARKGSLSDVIDAIKTGRSKSVGNLPRPETIRQLQMYGIAGMAAMPTSDQRERDQQEQEEKEYSNFQCQMILIKMIAEAHKSFLRYVVLFIIFGIVTGMLITYNFDYFKNELAKSSEEFEFMSRFGLIMQSVGEAPINFLAQDLLRLFGSNAGLSLAFVALGLRSFWYGRMQPFLGPAWIGLGEMLQGPSFGFYWVLIVDIGSNYALMVPDFMPEMKRRGIVRDRAHEEELNGCLRATMIGVMSSSMEGLGTALGVLLGGFISSFMGYTFLWDLCSLIAISTGFLNLTWEVSSKLFFKRTYKGAQTKIPVTIIVNGADDSKL